MATAGTLLYIREQFVKQSGRTDLVTDFEGGDYSDNGANLYIRAGVKYLDLVQEHPEMRREFKFDTTAGQYLQRIPWLRSIEEKGVSAYKSPSGPRTTLDAKPLGWLKENYTDEFDLVDRATPIYYTDQLLNLAPSQNSYASVTELEAAVAADTAGFSLDYQNILADNTFENRGILFLAPADGVYTMTVTGNFFSKFTEETDYCYWSAKFPELVIMAAQMAIEMFYRNSTGVRDWQTAMRPFLQGVDHDLVRAEMMYSGNTRKG